MQGLFRSCASCCRVESYTLMELNLLNGDELSCCKDLCEHPM